jgi:site-specific DNA-methyltransferase (adenine-specific)
MTPNYKDDFCEAYLGDCRRIVPDLDGVFDMVLTDPPYSSGGQFRGDRCVGSTRSKYQSSKTLKRYPEFTGDTMDQRAYAAWTEQWASICRAKLKPGGLFACFSDWRQLPTLTDALQMAGLTWRGIAVWDKTPATRPVLGRPRAQCEHIAWGTNGPHKPNGKPIPGCFTYSVFKEPKRHMTEKPVAVCDWLLGLCPEGGRVLDPFMGSGTTLKAARDRGIHAVGIEMQPEIFDIAVERLNECPT